MSSSTGPVPAGPPPPSAAASPSSLSDPAATSSSLNPLQSLRSNIDGLIISTVLSTSTLPGGNKETLSLQTTSANFRRFVQKSGPIFVAQDAVVSVFRWEDPAKTLFWAGAWAFLCIYPRLWLVVPHLVLIATLLTTHPKRGGGGKGPSDGEEKGATLASPPPAEGSVDYLANLTHIQGLMGQTADSIDAARLLVPYLTWAHPLTPVLFQLTVVSLVLTLLFSSFLPLPILFLLFGESALLFSHPLLASLAKSTLPLLRDSKTSWEPLRELLEEDALDEDDLGREMKMRERWEVESKVDGMWVAESGGGEGDEGVEKGWRWTREKVGWKIDKGGAWCDGKVDGAGWTYLSIDGSRSAVPGTASSRRRRLRRRMVKLDSDID